mmetsp:Transcript_28798/g.33849  ORF Transcript_28798/g.33849 Transcript_28798/m.33849 type:complete len:80 (+) Transcript_28798:450-689(+)
MYALALLQVEDHFLVSQLLACEKFEINGFIFSQSRRKAKLVVPDYKGKNDVKILSRKNADEEIKISKVDLKRKNIIEKL